jgi:CRP/FNR family transcriptional regulator
MDRVELRKRLIYGFPYFKNVNQALVEEILHSLRPFEFEEGQYIYHERDSCSGIAFMLAGEIRVYKSGPGAREVTLYTIGEGEICILNAACILSGSHYPADAVSTSQGNAYVLPAAEFRRLVDKYPEMRQFVLAGLSSRLFGIVYLMEEVLFRKLDERLVSYLKEKSESGIVASTHQNIANDLGTSREVISRMLSDLERSGKISIARSKIEIINL